MNTLVGGKCSSFIENRALFGAYPSQQEANELEHYGVRLFIDLTKKTERLYEHYMPNLARRINYPIQDRGTPTSRLTFSILLQRILIELNSMREGELMYIHCRGGHGRSGLVVACILTLYHNISPAEALELTAQFHQNRVEMPDYRRQGGSPTHERQKRFVVSMFEPMITFKRHGGGRNFFLSMKSCYSVEMYCQEDYKLVYSNAELAYKDMIKTLEQDEDYHEKKLRCLCDVIASKFVQHPMIMNKLISGGFRIIHEVIDGIPYITKRASMLMKLREISRLKYAHEIIIE